MKYDIDRAVPYFRISTLNQQEEYYSEEYYIDLFEKLGFPRDRIYFDVDSGGNNLRKGYRMVLEKIRTGEADTIVVPDFSRFTRSPEGWEEAIKDFQNSGACLITLDGSQFKLDTPENIYTSRMLVANAAYVREQNQHKSLKGYEFGRIEGRAFQPLFPYILDRGKLYPNHNRYKKTSKTMWEVGKELIQTFLDNNGNLSQTIRDMVAKYGNREPGKKLHEDFPHDASGLAIWLQKDAIRGGLAYFQKVRAKYRGKRYNTNPIFVVGTHEPLMTPEKWEQVRPLLNRGKGNKPKEISNPLQGLMFCAGCGAKMRTQGGRNNVEKYIVCSSAYPNSSAKRFRQESGELQRCDRRSAYGLKLHTAEPLIVEELCKRSKLIADRADQSELGIHEESLEIKAVRKKIDHLTLLADDDDPDYLVLIDKERRKLASLLAQRESGEILSERKARLIEYGKDQAFWMVFEPKERLILYRDFIRRIECNFGSMQIFWTEGLDF